MTSTIRNKSQFLSQYLHPTPVASILSRLITDCGCLFSFFLFPILHRPIA